MNMNSGSIVLSHCLEEVKAEEKALAKQIFWAKVDILLSKFGLRLWYFQFAGYTIGGIIGAVFLWAFFIVGFAL